MPPKVPAPRKLQPFPVTLRELAVLAAVVKSGSMAKAATTLGVSQPLISQAIAGLETSIGVRLLERTSHGVEPTRSARALLERSVVIFDEVNQALKEVQHLADPTQGEIRVGCPESLAAGFVPAMIDDLLQTYPKIIVRVLVVERAAPEFHQLHDRTLDLMFGRVIEPFPTEGLHFEILFSDRLTVAAAAKSAFARRRSVRLQELMDEPWILAPSDNVVGSFQVQLFARHGLGQPREAVSSFSVLIRNHLMSTGRFVTLAWESMLAFNAARWSLKALPLDFQSPRVPVGIYCLKSRAGSPLLPLFIKSARKIARTMPKP
jgi:DNA-binding transcriptional LysR family regulator